eukprot:tig00000383_g24718.t1
MQQPGLSSPGPPGRLRVASVDRGSQQLDRRRSLYEELREAYVRDGDDESFWTLPHVRLPWAIRKERVLGLIAGQMLRLESLKFDPLVVAALREWWAVTDSNGSGAVEKAEYMTFYMLMYKALNGSARWDPRLVEKFAAEDWKHDSGGHDTLDGYRFRRCLFEVANMWSERPRASDYALLLRSLLACVTRSLPGRPLPVFKSLDEVAPGAARRVFRQGQVARNRGVHAPPAIAPLLGTPSRATKARVGRRRATGGSGPAGERQRSSGEADGGAASRPSSGEEAREPPAVGGEVAGPERGAGRGAGSAGRIPAGPDPAGLRGDRPAPAPPRRGPLAADLAARRGALLLPLPRLPGSPASATGRPPAPAAAAAAPAAAGGVCGGVGRRGGPSTTGRSKSRRRLSLAAAGLCLLITPPPEESDAPGPAPACPGDDEPGPGLAGSGDEGEDGGGTPAPRSLGRPASARGARTPRAATPVDGCEGEGLCAAVGGALAGVPGEAAFYGTGRAEAPPGSPGTPEGSCEAASPWKVLGATEQDAPGQPAACASSGGLERAATAPGSLSAFRSVSPGRLRRSPGPGCTPLVMPASPSPSEIAPILPAGPAPSSPWAPGAAPELAGSSGAFPAQSPFALPSAPPPSTAGAPLAWLGAAPPPALAWRPQRALGTLGGAPAVAPAGSRDPLYRPPALGCIQGTRCRPPAPLLVRPALPAGPASPHASQGELYSAPRAPSAPPSIWAPGAPSLPERAASCGPQEGDGGAPQRPPEASGPRFGPLTDAERARLERLRRQLGIGPSLRRRAPAARRARGRELTCPTAPATLCHPAPLEPPPGMVGSQLQPPRPLRRCDQQRWKCRSRATGGGGRSPAPAPAATSHPAAPSAAGPAPASPLPPTPPPAAALAHSPSAPTVLASSFRPVSPPSAPGARSATPSAASRGARPAPTPRGGTPGAPRARGGGGGGAALRRAAGVPRHAHPAGGPRAPPPGPRPHPRSRSPSPPPPSAAPPGAPDREAGGSCTSSPRAAAPASPTAEGRWGGAAWDGAGGRLASPVGPGHRHRAAVAAFLDDLYRRGLLLAGPAPVSPAALAPAPALSAFSHHAHTRLPSPGPGAAPDGGEVPSSPLERIADLLSSLRTSRSRPGTPGAKEGAGPLHAAPSLAASV